MPIVANDDHDHNNKHLDQHDKYCATHNDDYDQHRHYDINDDDKQHIIDHDDNHD